MIYGAMATLGMMYPARGGLVWCQIRGRCYLKSGGLQPPMGVRIKYCGRPNIDEDTSHLTISSQHYVFIVENIMRLCNCTCCRRSGSSLGNRYGAGTGPILLDDLYCTGSETRLGNCPHRGWNSHSCRHYEDVSIACYNDSTFRGLEDLWLNVCTKKL